MTRHRLPLSGSGGSAVREFYWRLYEFVATLFAAAVGLTYDA
jgi:hypothetical protein